MAHSKSKRVFIFDTTLRDGEQSPGASMSITQKLQFARQLEILNVDIIEAGFPVSSQAQQEACQEISKAVKKPIVAALARAVKPDIDAAVRALEKAKKPRIHTFIATSDIHMRHKLNKTRSEVLKMAVSAVRLAKDFTKDVEFSAEDAVRSDVVFLKEIVEAVIEAGATTINIPDTVGYTVPQEYLKLMSEVMAVSKADKAVFSTHCHNDLGLAVANSLSALTIGARQIECAVNGIGERAGNCALEEVVMAIETRKDFFKTSTNINQKEIYRTSRLLTNITGIAVQPNKAIVGNNAFSHEAGIHQHGMLKNRNTYEIIRPESIGRNDAALVLGRHSGKHGLNASLIKLGIKVRGKDLDRLYQRFIKTADKKKEVYEEDLIAIINDTLNIIQDEYKLEYVFASSGTNTVATATVQLTYKNKTRQEAATGDGPVDAIYKAIDKITKERIKGRKLNLKEYEIQSMTGGQDAMGNVKVVLKDKHEGHYIGRGYSTDIIEASAKAYVNAINNYLRRSGGSILRGI